MTRATMTSEGLRTNDLIYMRANCNSSSHPCGVFEDYLYGLSTCVRPDLGTWDPTGRARPSPLVGLYRLN
jgi:hypothetical protein